MMRKNNRDKAVRTSCVIAVAVLLIWTGAVTVNAQASDPQSARSQIVWDGLVSELIRNNPELLSNESRIQSLDIIPDARMAWDDPVFSASVSNVPVDTFDTGQEAMTQKSIGVTQRIPSAWKRVSERERAKSMTDTARAIKAYRAAMLIEFLKKTVNEIIFLERSLLILTENEAILDEFIDIANAKYSVGKGIQSDVILAQVKRSELILKRLALDEKLKIARIRANRLLGREPSTDFVTPPPWILDGGLEYDSVWSESLKNSPAIILARRNVATARRGLEVARSMNGLNMALNAKYGQRDDTLAERPDFVSIGVGVSVPLWRSSKQDKYIASARFTVQEKAEALQDTILETSKTLKDTLQSIYKETQTIDLFRDGIIPQAEQALESSKAAYKLDKVEFLTMLTNEITLLDLQIGLERSIMHKHNLHARIEAITGASLNKENRP